MKIEKGIQVVSSLKLKLDLGKVSLIVILIESFRLHPRFPLRFSEI
jgi:hypothetical protein